LRAELARHFPDAALEFKGAWPAEATLKAPSVLQIASYLDDHGYRVRYD
jgi:hypothetical protein